MESHAGTWNDDVKPDLHQLSQKSVYTLETKRTKKLCLLEAFEVVAPTASGKTFIGYYAMDKAASNLVVPHEYFLEVAIMGQKGNLIG